MSEVWATKYRPRYLDDVVGQTEIVAEMRAIVLDEMPMQHYLFYSPEPGTGKTTMALALAKELGYQVVMFNASSKKQRGIEFIEETIIPATRSGVKERIFFLDEADQLTDAAQSALKGVIENAHGYFILTCNRLPKVSRWLQSRCQVRTFKKISEGDMAMRLRQIAKKEGEILYKDEINVITRRHDGDLRNAIGALQVVCGLEGRDREKFIETLTAPKLNHGRIIDLLSKQLIVEASKMFTGEVRTQIKSMFDYAVMANDHVNHKAFTVKQLNSIIDACVVSERDLMFGVDEDIVRLNFLKLILEGMN